jgi:hypothetical protein
MSAYKFYLISIGTLAVLMAIVPIYYLYEGDAYAAALVGVPSVVVLLIVFGVTRNLRQD